MAFGPLEWYCKPVKNGVWAKAVENAFGAYTPCVTDTLVICVSHLVLLGLCLYRIWRIKKDYKVKRFCLRSNYYNYVLAFLAAYCTAEPLFRLVMGISALNLDGQTGLAPYEIVALIDQALTWCSMLVMIGVETKVYIHNFRWFVRFGVLFVLVGDAVMLNLALAAQDFYNRFSFCGDEMALSGLCDRGRVQRQNRKRVVIACRSIGLVKLLTSSARATPVAVVVDRIHPAVELKKWGSDKAGQQNYSIRSVISGCQAPAEALFGVLLLAHVPSLNPYPGYSPLLTESTDCTEYEELSGGEQICPERQFSIFAQISFAWMNPLMQLGYKRPLTDKDVWKLDTWDRTETLNSKFQRCWAEESRKPKPWLLRALNSSLGGRFWWGGFWKVVNIFKQCSILT
ncbi:unnamed protein product [Ilex paraguariensis]|uniref:Uncharacterized protein n=1 Tax=Ilex paraguariensis TaxID=185542 RepID=A0ABC8SFY4_9AQUA